MSTNIPDFVSEAPCVAYFTNHYYGYMGFSAAGTYGIRAFLAGEFYMWMDLNGKSSVKGNVLNSDAILSFPTGVPNAVVSKMVNVPAPGFYAFRIIQSNSAGCFALNLLVTGPGSSTTWSGTAQGSFLGFFSDSTDWTFPAASVKVMTAGIGAAPSTPLVNGWSAAIIDNNVRDALVSVATLGTQFAIPCDALSSWNANKARGIFASTIFKPTTNTGLSSGEWAFRFRTNVPNSIKMFVNGVEVFKSTRGWGVAVLSFAYGSWYKIDILFTADGGAPNMNLMISPPGVKGFNADSSAYQGFFNAPSTITMG
jgi:hypothetical protein